MSWLLKRWLVPTEEKQTPSSSTPTLTTTPPVGTTQQIQQQLQQQQQTPVQEPPKLQNLIPNNVKLLIGGLIFFSISSIVTRRTLIRKHLSAIPPFYTSSVYHNPNVSGAMEAFEALNIATINTMSIAMVVAGGTLCALDIDSVEAARARLRKKLAEGSEGMVPPTKEEEAQFERDMENWLANVLGKEDLKEVRRKVEEARARQEQNSK